MNKKTILKMAGLLIMGGIAGAGITLGLAAGEDILKGKLLPFMSAKLIAYSLYMMIIVTLAMILPTIMNFTKGKKLLLKTEGLDDEALDLAEKEAQKYSNRAMAFNSILMALNIMMYGMSFDIEGPGFLMKTILFMIVTLSCAVVEILTVKLMQRHDDRLKGDPTSFGFHRDFLASCDEAEKLKIYESGYKAFQFSKNGAMFVVIFTVLLKITDFSGSFPIFISSISFLMILISYNYYAIKADS